MGFDYERVNKSLPIIPKWVSDREAAVLSPSSRPLKAVRTTIPTVDSVYLKFCPYEEDSLRQDPSG